jgi:hypothetical protein
MYSTSATDADVLPTYLLLSGQPTLHIFVNNTWALCCLALPARSIDIRSKFQLKFHCYLNKSGKQKTARFVIFVNNLGVVK